MSEGMKRRDVLVRLGLAAAGVGGAWWLRDNVLWRRPEVTFPAGAEWLAYDEPRADVPTAAVISEYIDVAYAFYARREVGFVNGLLDALAKEVRK